MITGSLMWYGIGSFKEHCKEHCRSLNDCLHVAMAKTDKKCLQEQTTRLLSY